MIHDSNMDILQLLQSIAHQKTASSADNLVSRTDSLNDWPDNLIGNIAHMDDIFKKKS